MLTQVKKSQACCQYLEFDSRLFSVGIGRVSATELTDELAMSCCDWADENSVQCLYYLCSASDSTSIQIADRYGFQLADVRLTFSISPAGIDVDGPTESRIPADIEVRPYRTADLPFLLPIASTSYVDTRFYQDPHFNRKACDRLYEIWLEKSCNGYANAVLVADNGREPVGFITCHLTADDAGNIGLVGVSDTAKGRGIGRALVQAALDWFEQQSRSYITVVTQERNVAAQKLYQRCGFSLQDTDLWFHRWLETAPLLHKQQPE
jgi:dTDP-4-amino-4,6-dideoxy-D-galactose acyltransferase